MDAIRPRDLIAYRHIVTFKNTRFEELLGDKVNHELLTSPPDIYSKFRVVILENGETYVNKHVKHNVFCAVPHTKTIEAALAKYNFTPTASDILVIACGDKPLSKHIKYIKQYKGCFKQIYHENKDIECDWIKTIPVWMMYSLMLLNGLDEFINIINNKPKKPQLLGMAFGGLYNNNNLAWANAHAAVKERNSLLKLQKHKPNLIYDFSSNINSNNDYFEQLASCKFFVAPRSNGMQPIKVYEALLCETVPVVIDSVVMRELRDIYNLPIIIIDSWSSLSWNFLHQAWNTVYKRVNWYAVKNRALVKNFEYFYINDQPDQGSNKMFAE